jgi:hypothetical protein
MNKRLLAILIVLAISACTFAEPNSACLPKDNLSVKVEQVMGVPTFVYSRNPSEGFTPFLRPCFETYAPELRFFKQFAQAGNTNAAACDYGHSKPHWIDVNNWDFSGFEERMKRVLEADPNAMVMPRVNMGTPRWWLDANPDELEILDNGATLYTQPNRNPTLPQGRAFPSLASEKWRSDMGMALKKFIDHIQASDYANHIFGYFLAGVDTEEWYHWSSGSDQLSGYSKHMKKAFQKWLKQKYADAATLRKAWNKPDIDFDKVEVPTREERYDLGKGTFRDPTKKMNVIDFYVFYNEVMVDTFDNFAKIIKEETLGKKVVGAFYGYMYEFRGDPEYGHNALEKYNKSPYLDFIFVTASYENRAFAKGGDYSRAPAYSCQLHKKLWYHDNDVCSFLAPKVLGHSDMSENGDWSKSIKHHLQVLGYTETAEQSIWMYRRSMGFALCSGAYESFFDLHGGYYNDPQLMAEVKKINEMTDMAKRYYRNSNSEILVVSDEASCSYTTFRSSFLADSLLSAQHQIIKIGAPADHILINDLELLNTDRYKLVIFLNNYNMTDAQRQLVDKKLKYGGKYLMWCYAPGYFNENKITSDNMEALTGIKIVPAANENFIAAQIALAKGSLPLNEALLKTEKTVIGPDSKNCRLFSVQDKTADVLGTIPQGSDVTLAIKNMGKWTSIYSITPVLPPSTYREIARNAGVHIYNEKDDTFYANTCFAAIHANGEGKRTITFPWATDIYDVMEQKYLGTNKDSITYDFKNGETLILRWKTRL